MKYCIRCGSKCNDTAKFCEACGEKIDYQPSAPQSDRPVQLTYQPSQEKKPMRSENDVWRQQQMEQRRRKIEFGAWISLACGILASLMCLCVPAIALPGSIVAVVFGNLSFRADESNTVAKGGLIAGGVSLFIEILMLVVFFVSYVSQFARYY